MSFIDLHCHMAWDIDDGIDSRAEAQQALQQARVDGIVKLAATPHFIPGAVSYTHLTLPTILLV